MSAATTAAPGPRRARRDTLVQRLINLRRLVQALLGIALWLVVTRYGISLGWVLLGATISGVVLGKYFCRWVCPMGAIMEVMLGAAGEGTKQKNLYSYFKVGCPISWVGGLLNKISALRVRVDESQCHHCGACDTACYVVQLSGGRSLHEVGRVNASTHYSCSRCLSCVKACPSGALSVGPSWPFGTLIPATRVQRGREDLPRVEVAPAEVHGPAPRAPVVDGVAHEQHRRARLS